jgi:hypothetical protein
MWKGILHSISVISVIVNAAILSISSNSPGVKSWLCTLERTILKVDNALLQFTRGPAFNTTESTSCLHTNSNMTQNSLTCMCIDAVTESLNAFQDCPDIVCHKSYCDTLYFKNWGTMSACLTNKVYLVENHYIAKIAFVAVFLVYNV